MTEKWQLQLGDILHHRYRMVSLIGTGGMSRVFLAEDLRLKGKVWAVKESRTHIAAQEFSAEAELLVRLDHPNLPQIVDYFLSDEHAISYLVMDYVKGKTLQEMFQADNKVMSVEQVLHYSIQLCELFTYIHTLQPTPIIYRDLKPANVMINEQNQVKLIDFGIARDYKLGQDADTLPLGTVGFAAPEQFHLAQSDARTDIFCLGALMYYLLSKGSYIHSARHPIDPSLVGGEVGIAEVISKATEPKPEHRYQDAEQCKNDLLQLQMAIASRQGSKHNGQSKLTRHSTSFLDFTDRQMNSSPAIVSIPPKLILIGSLWSQAGSSFFAMNIARALARRNVGVTYVEYPTIKPYLFDYLHIVDKVSEEEAYLDVAKLLSNQRELPKRKGWVEHGVQWIVNDPRLPRPHSWTDAHSMELLFALRDHPIIIVDMSNHWLDAGVQKLLLQADEWYVCVEPDPIKVDRLTMMQHDVGQVLLHEQTEEYRSLQALQAVSDQLAKPIQFIALKMHQHVQPSFWRDCLGYKPLTALPYIPYPELARHLWGSTFIVDDPNYENVLEQAFAPIFQAILPTYAQELPKKQEQGISLYVNSVKRLFNRRKR